MKGNLKSWVFVFAIASVIVLAAACGSKGDTGATGATGVAGNCPDLGSADVSPPTTAFTAASATTFTLACTDPAGNISGATTPAGTCGNTYYSDNGGTWTLYPGSAVTSTAGHTIKYFSIDTACNYETVKTSTL